VQSLRGKGVRFETTLPAEAPAMLIVAEGKNGPVYRVGFNNFYVITRYNRSPMYAMAVHDLGEAVMNFMRDASR
jgi:membrane-bound lytic murein transglycosylase B